MYLTLSVTICNFVIFKWPQYFIKVNNACVLIAEVIEEKQTINASKDAANLDCEYFFYQLLYKLL